MRKNILIVDDSALMRRFISDIIEKDDRFIVKDVARNGVEAVELVKMSPKLYNAVIMDINMPQMDGLEALKHLQEYDTRAGIVMMSGSVEEGGKETILALENGAVDFVKKPESYSEVKGEVFKNRVLDSICAACEVNDRSTSSLQHKIGRELPKRNTYKTNMHKTQLIAIACSTGGPKSLKEVIPKLPQNIAAPVVIVQHMPAGFTKSLADRLNDISSIQVKEAEHGEMLRKGCVYLAPGGKHFRIIQKGKGNYYVKLSEEMPRDGLRPCANVMYESMCDIDLDNIICTVLTGMGSDGTNGIKQLKLKNNIYVIAQDEDTSVVYGMPRAVALAGLADEILPLENIADAITKNAGVLNDGR